MKRIIKILSICILTVFVTSVPIYASEENVGYTPHTQQDAVNWATSQIGKSLDYDHQYGAQCVDLIKYYYDYFGVAEYAMGNANAYITRTLPSGWTRVYGNYQPGDIAVWKTNHSCGTCTTYEYGHIGIITSADSVGFNAVNQNYGETKYCTQNWFYISALACGIRPAFSTAEINISYSNLGTSYIDDGNAIICGTINNPSGALVTRVGAYIWDDSGNLVVDYSEGCNRSNSKINQALDSIMEAKVALSSGRKYTFQLWAEANGKIFYSDKAQFTTSDSIVPVISNVSISDITLDGYTITCTATDNANINRVQFPTWTVNNGQDDLFSEWWTNAKCTGTRNGTTWSYRVHRSDHNNELGTYQTHIYAYDDAGNYISSIAPEVVLKENLKNGWINESGNTYYYQNNVKLTGFQKINGLIYYFKVGGDTVNKGRMLKGWQKIFNRYYYFKTSGDGAGRMLYGGWKKISGKYYYFNGASTLPSQSNLSGTIKTGFKKIGRYYYYLNPKGSKGVKGCLLTGYQTFAEVTRYFKVSGTAGIRGRMLIGSKVIDGERHYFKTSGSNIGVMEY